MMISVWLLPSNNFYQPLQQQIATLAQEYDEPIFSPHVTLFSGNINNIDKTKIELDEIFAHQSALTLTFDKLNATEAYYKSLFIQFNDVDRLNTIFAQVKQTLDPSSHYQLHPHLSLLYSDMPLPQKQKIMGICEPEINGILGANQRIILDRVQLRTDYPDENRAAVEQWEVLHTIELE